MKNFTRKLTALILSVMMLMSIAPSMGLAAEAENAVLNTLQNTLYKLSTDKELNVGYIGGSITVGANAVNVNTDSYRALTTAWMKEKFPEATITEINVSTGGTGSQYGLWRANTDLKLGTENQPDLTFIEYAVNDAYDKQTKAQASFYMESLVNKLYAANPNMDIVILLSTDVNKRNEDNVFPQLVAHREVAQRYGIPYIENGYKLYNEIYAANGNVKVTGNTWKDDAVWCTYFSDIVHPTNAGHAKYSGYIQEYLTSVLLAEDVTVPEALTEKELPEPINANLAWDSYVDTAAGQNYSPYGNQWTINESTGAISATKANQTFEFSFNGTGLEVMSNASADYGNLAYTIDGTEYSANLSHGDTKKIASLASGLEEGTHKVSIRTTDKTLPEGKTLTIEGFSIIGDSTKAGITVPVDDSVFEYYVLTPKKVIQNLKFSDGTKTDTVGNKVMVGGNNMPNYIAPFFFQYDLSELKGKSIVSSYYIHGLTVNSASLALYDVPGDDLTITYKQATEEDGTTPKVDENGDPVYTTIPNRIPVNETAVATGWASGTSTIDLSAYPGAETLSSSFGFNFTIDVKAYITEQNATENSLATFMVYDSYGGGKYFSKADPRIWVKVAKENDVPVVELSAPEQIKLGQTADIIATITDNNEISGITAYVDGEISDAVVTNDGNSYTISFADLTAGTHTIKVVAVDKYGASAQAEASIFVKADLPSTAKGMVVYSDVSNPDFIEQKSKQTYNQYNWMVWTGSDKNTLKAPLYLSYDIKSLVDPDGDGVIDYDIKDAYLITMGASNDRPLNIYDIPSNDISLSTIGVTNEDGTTTYTPPEMGEMVTSYHSAAQTKFNELKNAGAFGDLSTGQLTHAHNITKLAKAALVADRTSFSIMLYTTDLNSVAHIGSGDADKKPRIYLNLIEKPELEIVSAGTQEYVIDDATFTVNAYDEAGIEKVEYYIDDELKATVTEGVDGAYTWTASDLIVGEYTLKVVATALSGATQTAVEKFNIKGLNKVIKFTNRIAVNNTDKVVLVPTQNNMTLDRRSGYDNIEAYYNFDISALKNNSSEIEKVYLATNGKNGGRVGLVYNCNDYDLKLVSNYEDVSNIIASGDRIAYFNSQSPTLSDKVNTVDAALYPELAVYGVYNLMRHDITELVQTSLAEDDTTLTLKFTAGDASLFESQYPLYLYVEYKDDTPLVVDNGSSLKINVRPSRYITPAADTAITVAVASYNEDGTLAGIETNDFDAKDIYTSYTSELDADDYKVFVWDSVGAMKSLNTPVTNITEGE